MRLFRVNVVARKPKDESRETPPVEALSGPSLRGSEVAAFFGDRFELGERLEILRASRCTLDDD